MKLLSENVWFLAHPIAPDEKYKLMDNLFHIEKLVRMCFRAGLLVVAPYYLTCLALDDRIVSDRELGMRANDGVILRLGRLLLTGHRLSSGMNHEAQLMVRAGHDTAIMDLIGVRDDDFVQALISRFTA
jgi:hypothetical protein